MNFEDGFFTGVELFGFELSPKDLASLVITGMEMLGAVVRHGGYGDHRQPFYWARDNCFQVKVDEYKNKYIITWINSTDIGDAKNEGYYNTRAEAIDAAKSLIDSDRNKDDA
jgi:hypothetical protein